MAWYMEHYWRICAILSGLLVGETRPQEKGTYATANPTIRKQMTDNHNEVGCN